MPAMQLFPTYSDEQLTHMKLQALYQYDYDPDERKTRNSTFSKASDGREEIQRNVSQIYEKAFAQNNNKVGFLQPLDNECDTLNVQSPAFIKQQSGKSP